MQCLFYLLNILIVPLQEEVRTVPTHPVVKWISEPTTWASEITVPQGIRHLICCYISGYLQSRKQEMIDTWRRVRDEGKQKNKTNHFEYEKWNTVTMKNMINHIIRRNYNLYNHM
jgi:hypothetical protein